MVIDINIKKELVSSSGAMSLSLKLKIPKGDIVALLGNSGAGKTTALRIIAGLTAPDEGIVSCFGEEWFHKDKNINISPVKRKIGYVFQDYALFPNMSVLKNVAYGIKLKENKDFIDELLNIVGLYSLKNRMTDKLSGGQKQRVALARAIAVKPSVFLLDEPLSALDAALRAELQDKIIELHNKYEMTTVIVSHDLGEVIKLAKTVFFIENGKIINEGSADCVIIKNSLSGKFRFTGVIINIKKEDVVYIVTILIGNNLVKVIATENEILNLKEGSRVMVSSKAFNPIITSI
jgi:molybdate transport system ATP-binding protein